MSKVFEGFINELSEKTGYGYDYLVDRYNEMAENNEDVDSFVAITMERDW